MKPMLAFRYADHRDRFPPPFYLQPKLNGVRAIYCNGLFQSRDEKLWHPSVLHHIQAELCEIIPPSYLLDGELYVHGWSLQQINSAIAVNRTSPSPKTPLVQYHIFDLIDKNQRDLSFTLRNFELNLLLERIKFNCFSSIQVVPTFYIDDLTVAEHLYLKWRREGYEGAMYRSVSSPYGLIDQCSNQENRWKCLLKRKDWLDDEFDVVGWTSGEGKHEGRVGALVCRLENGATFNVGTGLSDEQRESFVENLPPRVKVRYEALSDGGIPLKPTIEFIFDNE